MSITTQEPAAICPLKDRRLDLRTTVSIVMRSFNDVAVIEETLRNVRQQSGRTFQLLNIDSGSTDGTAEIVERYTDRMLRIRPEEYIPGHVLNMGMKATDGDIVVFLNSDCTPVGPEWLETLIAPFENPDVSAVFGRQLPRPDCWALYRKDTDTAFGDGSISGTWHHFFSMANSAVRRSVWERNRFDPQIRYSEDVEWSYRLRSAGHRIAYAQHAAVTHSHNYTLRQVYKRQKGEGDADARIFDFPRWRTRWPTMVLLGAVKDIARDVRWCLKEGEYTAILHSLALRPTMRHGRWVGFHRGRADRERTS